MDDFSSFMNLKENLVNLKQYKPAKIEKFINRLETLGVWEGDILNKLDKFIVDTGGKTFIKPIAQWNAAQDFVSARPNFLRFSAIAGTLGALTGFDTTQSKVGTIGGAMLIGTPAGARVLLRTAAKMGSLPKAAAHGVGRELKTKLGQRAAPNAISSLLRMSER
jgi:hypothetical protein